MARLLAILGIVLTVRVQAQDAERPVVHLVATGDCPGAGAIRANLEPWLRVVDGPEEGAWRVDVQGTRLLVRDPGGGVATRRVLQSDDCPAVAEAFGFIVRLHFVELEMLPAGAASAELPALLPDLPNVVSETGEVAVVGGPEQTGAADTPDVHQPSLFSVGVRAGPSLAADPKLIAIAGSLDLNVRLAGPVRLQLVVGGVTSTNQERASRIRTYSLNGQLGAVLRLDQTWGFVQPGLGAGLVLTRVTARELEGRPTRTRYYPSITGSFTVGLCIAGPVSFVADLGIVLLPSGDSYVIEPLGVVGQSPLATFSLGFGLQIDLGK